MLLPGLPPALESFARSRFTNDVLARRALLAPWPDLDFHSAWDDRRLWATGEDPKRRETIERLITVHQPDWFRSVDQPYFPAEGTLGTLRSPHPQLTDPEYWLYVAFWGGEEGARLMLARPLFDLGWKSTLDFLAAERGRGGGLLARLRPRTDPRLTAWQANLAQFAANYS